MLTSAEESALEEALLLLPDLTAMTAAQKSCVKYDDGEYALPFRGKGAGMAARLGAGPLGMWNL